MSLGRALEMVSRSDAGMLRSQNEDAVFCSPQCGLAILADGMGGYKAGEVASSMAVNILGAGITEAIERVDPHRTYAPGRQRVHVLLESEIVRANAAVFEASRSQPQYAGMGTTLVVALFYDNAVSVAHVGDSRLYRLREGRLERLTRDHSLLQEQIDSGMITAEEARRSQNRNLVTRALGTDAQVEPEIRDYDTLPGDLYLLCSDGLNDMLDDVRIAQAVSEERADLERAANRLVQLANEAGGRDNVSVVLVRVVRDYAAARGVLDRLRELVR